MVIHGPAPQPQVVDAEWMTFPGGELEGKRPRARCPACLARGGRPESRAPLCFQCYRAELDRERALKAAGQLDTASDERFQTTLPFEPVDMPRLQMLRVARAAERAAERAGRQMGAGRYVDKRRQAQIAARHALQQIAAGVQARGATLAAIHAAELQLPEAWIPFVVSR
jgi:hypothetical protein